MSQEFVADNIVVAKKGALVAAFVADLSAEKSVERVCSELDCLHIQ